MHAHTFADAGEQVCFLEMKSVDSEPSASLRHFDARAALAPAISTAAIFDERPASRNLLIWFSREGFQSGRKGYSDRAPLCFSTCVSPCSSEIIALHATLTARIIVSPPSGETSSIGISQMKEKPSMLYGI